jgi:hypothetical protein
MIVTEFMGCGSLADTFKSNATLSTRRCVQLALECARGIAYLHNHHPLSIIHRWGRGLTGCLGRRGPTDRESKRNDGRSLRPFPAV